MMESEEDRVWEEQKQAAYAQADAARRRFREDFEVTYVLFSILGVCGLI